MRLEKLAYFFGVIFVVATFLGFAIAQDRTVPHTAAVSQAAKPSQTTLAAATAAISGKKLVFGDEFSGTKLNDGNWATCYDWRLPTETGCTNGGNFEQEWYTNSQVQVQSGNLVLTADQDPVDVSVQKQPKSFDYQSGMVNSGAGATNSSVRWVGTYGYFEAKMKFQKGQGIWPAFWLLPANKQWPPEIDAMEFIGSKPNQILQTVHWQVAGAPQKDSAVISGEKDYSVGWHTYGVDWEPDHIDWYIDGKKTRSYEGPNIPNTPMEIIIDLAVGGLLPGNVDKTTLFPSELWVDYVHVYQATSQARPHQY